MRTTPAIQTRDDHADKSWLRARTFEPTPEPPVHFTRLEVVLLATTIVLGIALGAILANPHVALAVLL